MILEDTLYDLADHLDHPAGDDLVGRVIAQLEQDSSPAATSRPWDHQRFLVAAAIVAAILVALSVYTPSRDAIAGWLGLGSVAIRIDPAVLPEGPAPLPGAVEPGASGPPGISLGEAQELVDFPIVLPMGEEPPTDIAVDLRPPGGLVALTYPDFTLVAVASAPGEIPSVVKTVEPESVVLGVDVDGQPGKWIEGEAHQISYLDRNGEIQTDSVRTAGNVLLWEGGGATYRIEGIDDLDEALAVASSME